MGVKKAWVVFGTVLGVWLCYSSLHVAAQLTDPKEVKALLAIRRSLNDPVGCLKNWKKGDPCTSKWYGVLCFNVIESDGYLHVKELQLINMSLSGSLSPELGRLSYMKILDFMWNKISGTIPKEIGSISSLELLLLNGNELSGSLPEELGDLSNLNRIQIDENNISGPIPKSFGNLNNTKHVHLNNNSLSGQIPPELSKISSVVHLLLDNNNLSGNLPPQFSELPYLRILQLDNNHFHGTIPDSYRNMSKLLKMSLRNCGLQGPVPDLSSIPNLLYLDLSQNQLNGSIPSNKLSVNITTIDLSNNHLNGPIPANFTGLFRLQRLLLENNSLTGDVPSNIWQNRRFNGNESLILDFRNNKLSGISDTLNPPTKVSIRLQSNPVCEVASQPQIVQFCGSQSEDKDPQISTDTQVNCPVQSCPDGYEYVKNAPIHCFCAAPLRIGIRLKSPGISDFVSYENQFQAYLTSGILLDLYQLSIVSFIWEPGPRLRMYLKLFPEYNPSSHMLNDSEILRLKIMFTGWKIHDSDIFGPRELLNFTLLRPYQNVILDSPKSGIKKRDLIKIVLGAIVGSIVLYAVVFIFIKRIHARWRAVSKNGSFSNSSIVVDGVKGFTFVEMSQATNNFNSSNHVGKGGYGDVYKGILADGRMIAVKRAVIDSLQGEKEFLTEIELLSRVHHRNLVSLVGYCVEKGEQMLVYEFMPNGTLRDHLSVKSVESLSFSTRLNIALGSAKGVLYLHTAADPPIFHRDIKASNILLDSKFTAKVADFGLSKLAPVPDGEGNVLCHVSTVVKGTAGYLDPEYLLTHDYTDKSDVYSLGIVFLELVTGMQPISHGKNIVREVNKAYQSGMIFSIIDARMGSYPSESVERFLTLALKCCKGGTVDRPSMGEVVRDLEEINFLMSDSTPGTSASMVTDPASFGFQSYSSQLSSKGKNIDMSSDISGSDISNAISDIITAR